jgi:hypothetical protein
MRFHKGNDGWGRDSYRIPEYAVAGCSYTGNAPDSPCPESTVRAETSLLRKHLLTHGIRARLQHTASGNCCRAKIWVCVTGKVYASARTLADTWLADHHHETRLIHDAT